jgi:hypothetical protein
MQLILDTQNGRYIDRAREQRVANCDKRGENKLKQICWMQREGTQKHAVAAKTFHTLPHLE